MLKTRVSRPLLQQICSESAFPGLPWNVQKLLANFGRAFMGFAGHSGRRAARKPRFQAAHVLQKRWASSLPRPSSGPGNRAQAASTGGTFGLMTMKHRQQAQVKPLASLAMKHRQATQLKPGNHAQLEPLASWP